MSYAQKDLEGAGQGRAKESHSRHRFVDTGQVGHKLAGGLSALRVDSSDQSITAMQLFVRDKFVGATGRLRAVPRILLGVGSISLLGLSRQTPSATVLHPMRTSSPGRVI